jgi:hypothetical protein
MYNWIQRRAQCAQPATQAATYTASPAHVPAPVVLDFFSWNAQYGLKMCRGAALYQDVVPTNRYVSLSLTDLYQQTSASPEIMPQVSPITILAQQEPLLLLWAHCGPVLRCLSSYDPGPYPVYGGLGYGRSFHSKAFYSEPRFYVSHNSAHTTLSITSVPPHVLRVSVSTPVHNTPVHNTPSDTLRLNESKSSDNATFYGVWVRHEFSTCGDTTDPATTPVPYVTTTAPSVSTLCVLSAAEQHYHMTHVQIGRARDTTMDHDAYRDACRAAYLAGVTHRMAEATTETSSKERLIPLDTDHCLGVGELWSQLKHVLALTTFTNHESVYQVRWSQRDRCWYVRMWA